MVRFSNWLLLTVMFLFVVGGGAAFAENACADALPKDLRSFIDEYIQAYNARNADAILALYAEDAKISNTKSGKVVYMSKSEYVPVLRGKLADAERKGQSITGWEVLASRLEGDQAELKVKINGKRWVFTGSETGSFNIEKRSGRWQIVKDDL